MNTLTQNQLNRIIELKNSTIERYAKLRKNRELNEITELEKIQLAEYSGMIKAYKELIFQFNIIED